MKNPILTVPMAGMFAIAPFVFSMADAAPAQAQSVEATYQGTYQVGMLPRQKRNPTIGDLIAGGKPHITNQGGVVFKLKINGMAVSGTIEPMGLGPAELAGTMKNGVCKLMTKEATYEGKCGSEGFSGKISGFYKNGRELKGEFETLALSFEDVTQRNAQNAAKQQQGDARRADLKKRCDAGSNTACVELEQLGQ